MKFHEENQERKRMGTGLIDHESYLLLIYCWLNLDLRLPFLPCPHSINVVLNRGDECAWKSLHKLKNPSSITFGNLKPMFFVSCENLNLRCFDRRKCCQITNKTGSQKHSFLQRDRESDWKLSENCNWHNNFKIRIRLLQANHIRA